MRHSLAAVAGLALLLTGCSSRNQPLSHSEKGYELYSWKVGTDWHYTLITGTNRLKTFSEVTAVGGVVDDHGMTKITMRGADKAAQTVYSLPKGETVTWSCPASQGYSFPPQEALTEIQSAADQKGLDFRVQR